MALCLNSRALSKGLKNISRLKIQPGNLGGLSGYFASTILRFFAVWRHDAIVPKLPKVSILFYRHKFNFYLS